MVGLACGCCVAGCEASLTNLAVCPSLRGRGLGRTLATELLSRLGWVLGGMALCVGMKRVSRAGIAGTSGWVGWCVGSGAAGKEGPADGWGSRA